MKTLLIGVMTTLVSVNSVAGVCKPLPHKQGEIIEAKAAKYLGTRIQLPSNLVTEPTVSNAHLWDVDGIQGTNQIMIKPNSGLPEGASTMIFAFTEDGAVYDILAKRVKRAHNQPCLLVNAGRGFMNDQQKQAISTFVLDKQPTTPNTLAIAKIKQLETQLSQATLASKGEKDKAVMDALRKYRYRIYTRYGWEQGGSFIGQNVISDVYDDGQFTYVRLANPNRGVLSVETEVGGKAAIAPTKYDDAYGIYRITGIYPRLTLRIDDVAIDVKRTDNVTRAN
jgi:hypothetical protein